MSTDAINARPDRVRQHTGAGVNQRLDDESRGRLERMRSADPVQIGRRINELDREWDVDRALMATFAVVGGANFAMGLSRQGPFKKSNGWLVFLGTQMTFLMVHAVAGWCPPVALLRRLGFRTSKEIEAERRALEAMVSGADGGRAQ